MKGDDYSMIRYIHRRISNNKNFLATITGPTGSGKSWTALSIAELLDPTFNIDRIIFRGKDLMTLINHGNLKPGNVILWDEAGIDLSNRSWQSVTNKMLNYLLQTFRHKNFILIFTVPFHDFIDSSSRKLFHADFETQRINKNKQTVIIKPKLLQCNSNLSKWYRKYLITQINGTKIKIKRWAVPKPSDALIKDYEAKKNQYTGVLNADIEKELTKLDGEKEDKHGVDVTCDNPECGYTWRTRTNKDRIQCPDCGKRVEIHKKEFTTVMLQSAPELNLEGLEKKDVEQEKKKDVEQEENNPLI